MNPTINPSQTIKILIVDDHALIRSGIIALLKKYSPDWDFYEAADGVRAIMKAQEVNPDIILLDYHMPKLDGVKAANIIKKGRPESKIIMVSMDMGPEIIIEMIRAGVSGIVSKYSNEHELLQAIKKVQNGSRHLSETATELAARDLIRNKTRKRYSRNTRSRLFTDRETEILRYVVKGLPSAAIARILSISVRTVTNHKASMFRKCNVKSTIELVRIAIKMGII